MSDEQRKELDESVARLQKHIEPELSEIKKEDEMAEAEAVEADEDESDTDKE